MRSILIITTILFGSHLSAQLYTVNTNDDIDDGVCNIAHCSLREAIHASEADGVASKIVFNIPGTGTHEIVPSGPFPDITKDELFINGESQPGEVGSIIIDFDYRNFALNPFWRVNGKRFQISGIDFRDFYFSNSENCIFKFGDLFSNASDCSISHCSFINSEWEDTITNYLIYIIHANDLNIANNNFGTDHTRSDISNLGGCISVSSNQQIAKVTIQSNIFVNRLRAIECNAGDVTISKNIFGAFDTFKTTNFLNPELAIWAKNLYSGVLNDNFFFGYGKGTVALQHTYGDLTISKNRFYDNTGPGVIDLYSNSTSAVYITDNYATLQFNNSLNTPHTFIYGLDNISLYVERNEVSNYGTFFIANAPPNYLFTRYRHIGNKIKCMWSNAVVLKGHPKPTIEAVNRNQIAGTGSPNDSIVIYSNNRIACPGAICEGGVELGRTKADNLGNWILNVMYPDNTSLSAFQYSIDPNILPYIYSGFSNCYQCFNPVNINISPSLCSGQTFSYRGKVYSELNPDDSIFIKGDGVICDSTILVHVKFKPKYYELKIPSCYPDTIQNDTVVLPGNGCDSVVITSRFEVGVNHLLKTICDTSSFVIIGGKKFDKNNSSGMIIIRGAAEAGCDSIIFVKLNFISIDTSLAIDGIDLVAFDSGATYQWLDCDQAFMVLPYDTSQHFTPARNGNFAVVISRDGCIDTSSCYKYINVGLSEPVKKNKIKVSPNPTDDKIKIELFENDPVSIIICNSNGQKLSQQISNLKSLELDLSNYNPGIYYFQFIGSNIRQINKIIKK